jgi:hypothetical protein
MTAPTKPDSGIARAPDESANDKHATPGSSRNSHESLTEVTDRQIAAGNVPSYGRARRSPGQLSIVTRPTSGSRLRRLDFYQSAKQGGGGIALYERRCGVKHCQQSGVGACHRVRRLRSGTTEQWGTD